MTTPVERPSAVRSPRGAIVIPQSRNNALADRANFAIVAAMALSWATPLLRFWGAAFGPFRPFDYPPGDVAPPAGWFVLGLAACFAPCVLSGAFYTCWEGACGVRLYRGVGVRLFKWVATNGDLINRWARRHDPAYRVIHDRAEALAWAEGCRASERAHWVLLIAGLLSAAYAARIGWWGWAAALTATNLVFNAYPILLQRYNRCRIERLYPTSR